MTIARKNTGIEMPISASTVIRRSDRRPAVTAETTPTRIPKKSQMMAAPMQRENVAGRPSLICCHTLSWLEYEIKFPLKSAFIMSKYWMKKGLSRPSFWRMSAMFWGVASLPAMRWAGSPPGIFTKIR